MSFEIFLQRFDGSRADAAVVMDVLRPYVVDQDDGWIGIMACLGLGIAGNLAPAMTAPHGTGSSEMTKRLLEESRELLKDMTERLSDSDGETATVPADPA